MFWTMFAVLLFFVLSFVLGLWFLRHTVDVAETVIDEVNESESEPSPGENDEAVSNGAKRRSVKQEAEVR